MKIKSLIFTILLVLILGACGQGEDSKNDNSEAWPEKNIEFIVPFGEGGTVDGYARGLAGSWEEQLDTQITVDNQAGASGLLGAENFLETESDGSTFFVGLQPTLSMNMVVQGADFSLDDFKLVNMEQEDYVSVTVPKDSPYDTMDELIDDIKDNPGEISMSVSAGSGTELFGHALADVLDLDVNLVTFDSGGAQRTDILGGHSDFAAIGSLGNLAIKDETKVLAVASDEEFPGFDAPPINDVLEKYTDETLPPIGDNRFIAVHRDFADENPEVFERIVDSYKEHFESEQYTELLKSTDRNLISSYNGPEKSKEIVEDNNELVEKYGDLFKGE